jgi:hypothetical protein
MLTYSRGEAQLMIPVFQVKECSLCLTTEPVAIVVVVVAIAVVVVVVVVVVVIVVTIILIRSFMCVGAASTV